MKRFAERRRRKKAPADLIDRKRVPIVIRKVASKKWEASGKREILVLGSFIFGLGPYLLASFSRGLELRPLPRDPIVRELFNQVFERSAQHGEASVRLRQQR